jgi:hypothetical protein
MEAAVSVVTDIHHAPADRAVTVENIKFPESEIRVLRPRVRHPADFHALVKSIGGAVLNQLEME